MFESITAIHYCLAVIGLNQWSTNLQTWVQSFHSKFHEKYKILQFLNTSSSKTLFEKKILRKNSN